MSRIYWYARVRMCTTSVPHANRVFGLKNVGYWLEYLIS